MIIHICIPSRYSPALPLIILLLLLLLLLQLNLFISIFIPRHMGGSCKDTSYPNTPTTSFYDPQSPPSARYTLIHIQTSQGNKVRVQDFCRNLTGSAMGYTYDVELSFPELLFEKKSHRFETG